MKPLQLVVLLLVFAAGCSQDARSRVRCEPEEHRDQQRCVDGVWIVANMDATTPDVPDAGCTPESEDELCASWQGTGASCGVVVVTDRCGDVRQPDCGTCAGGETCDPETRQCTCEPQTVEEFCQAMGADCGKVNGTDNCGQLRDENCGSCEGGIACGGMEPNVCGCPCFVDGKCRPAGQSNPDNPCQYCDPANPDAWTIDSGASCDDGNSCTHDDVCGDDGTCVGEPLDCGCGAGLDCEALGLDASCHEGLCDETTGTCFPSELADGTPCADDGEFCTSDVCAAGICEHPIASDSCRIANACYAAGDEHPETTCRVCDPSQSVDEWTVRAGETCDDGDGLSCTVGTCNNGGACRAQLLPDRCAIDGTCYATGDLDPQNDCRACQPSVSTTSFTDADGFACDDGLACTVGDTCSGGACEQGTIAEGMCLIDGQCYNAGDVNPATPCQSCDPASDPMGWTSREAGTTCSPGCRCDGNGQCLKQGDGQPC